MLDKIGLDEEGRRRLPRAHRQRRAAAHRRSWRSRRSCPGRSWRRWSPQQWRKIGIQAEVQGDGAQARASRARSNNEHQIFVWNNGGTELLYLFPRHAIPVDPDAKPSWGRSTPSGTRPAASRARKPDDPEHAEDLRAVPRRAGQQEAERNKNAQEIWKILVDQQYGIGTVGQSPALDGRAAGHRTGWAISRRGSASPSTAARRAVRIRRRGTTRNDAHRGGLAACSPTCFAAFSSPW